MKVGFARLMIVAAMKKMAFAIFCCALLMLVAAPAWAQSAPDPCNDPHTGALPLGSASGCGAVITVTGVDGNGNATFFTVTKPAGGNGNPYDGDDDVLVGIVNNSGSPLNSLTLNSPDTTDGGIFGFDGDGPCGFGPLGGTHDCFNDATPGMDPYDYQGPQNTFTIGEGTSCTFETGTCFTTGTVHFNPPIPTSSSCSDEVCTSNSTWFALEGTPDSLTSITQTQPTPPGVTTLFDFGPFNFKSTPAANTTNDNSLTITAISLAPGTPITFADGTHGICTTYSNTGGNCRAFDIKCTGTSCDAATYFAEFSTAYDVDHSILGPGLAKGEPDCGDIPHTTFTNQIDFFSQTSKDPTTKGRSGGTASCWIAVENVNYPNADLSVTKVGPLLVKRGAPLPYGIAVLNLGPGTATAVTVTDPIPAGTTFLNSAVCFTGKSGVTCQSGAQSPCVSDGTRVTCTLGNLLPFSLKTLAAIGIQLNFTAPAASGTVSNTAAVSALNPDLKTGNNTSTWKTTVK